MPAVMIRQLDALTKIIDHSHTALSSANCSWRRQQMIRQSSIESVPEPLDKADVQRQYDLFLRAAETKPTPR